MEITVKLSAGIVMVLELDSPEIANALGVRLDKTTKNHAWVTGDRVSLSKLAEACEHRRSMAYDQPLSWARSARAAEIRIRAALAGAV